MFEAGEKVVHKSGAAPIMVVVKYDKSGRVLCRWWGSKNIGMSNSILKKRG